MNPEQRASALRLADALTTIANGRAPSAAGFAVAEAAALLRELAQGPRVEPDMSHPKIQVLIGSKARLSIELSLIEQLLDDPTFEPTAMDMEYWGPLHDKLSALLNSQAEPDRRETDSTGAMAAAWFGTLGAEKAVEAVFGRAEQQESQTPLQEAAHNIRE